MNIVKAAIYARVSTQEQAAEGTSLEHQLDELARYCQLQGWQIAGTYNDPGFTGKDADRPALKRLMADAGSGVFDKVVVYKLDRLSRKLRLLLELQEKLQDYNTSLYSVKEAIDTSTAIGRTVFQVLGLVSEWERDAIVERTKNGRLQRYKEGCWAAGKPSYGYAYNKETKKLVINEAEERVVRRIFEQYVIGKSLTEVANMLNDEAIPARGSNGNGWRHGAIRDIIVNSAYKGALIVNRHQHIAKLPKGKSEQAITISVPSIVDEAIWKAAQQRRKSNRHLQPMKREQWLLQGMITCGLCGLSVSPQFDHHTVRTYSCRGRLRYTHPDGSPRCTCPRHKADWLEAQVWQRIEAVLNDPNRLQSVLEDTIKRLKSREAELNARIRPVDERLSVIAKQKSRLADDWVKLNIETDRFQQLQQSLEQEEARLRSIRNEIDPAQLQELEHTKGILRFWERQMGAMEWNLVDEEGQIIRLVDSSHEIALKIVGIEDKDISKIMHFPATRRELLNLLQLRIVVFEDRIELNAIFPIQSIGYPSCTST